MNSAKYAAAMARYLGIGELPLDSRSDEWWTEFWREMGMAETQRVREVIV